MAKVLRVSTNEQWILKHVKLADLPPSVEVRFERDFDNDRFKHAMNQMRLLVEIMPVLQTSPEMETDYWVAYWHEVDEARGILPDGIRHSDIYDTFYSDPNLGIVVHGTPEIFGFSHGRHRVEAGIELGLESVPVWLSASIQHLF